jgi:hypothetical protein
MEMKEWMMEDWSWYFTGSSREESTLGEVWLDVKEMTREILKHDRDAQVCIWVCRHEGAFNHCHGTIKTHLGQNKLKRHWRRGNTKFKRFDHTKKYDLWAYLGPQKVGPPITNNEEDAE